MNFAIIGASGNVGRKTIEILEKSSIKLITNIDSCSCEINFNNKILGWAGNENSKMRFKSKNDFWTLQSTYLWANKKIDKNRENKKLNTKILIEQFFKLTGIKKTKVLFSSNHGWKYSSNSNPLRIKSYWNSSLNLGVCADWFVGPRLESGWISAQDLFNKINR